MSVFMGHQFAASALKSLGDHCKEERQYGGRVGQSRFAAQ